MKVKKYIAATMPEAMQQIRKELGSNAVILHSKEIHQGGMLGLFKKRKMEVVAALDPQPFKPKEARSGVSIAPNRTNDGDVLAEMKQIKKLMEQQASAHTKYSTDFQIVYQHLLDQEVAEHIAAELIENILKQQEADEATPTLAQIFQYTRREIKTRLQTLSFNGITYDKQIVHFVGPTGVGKTTTLAKVAASCMLKDDKKVAFITTDTYRIAAIDQLKTYARILDVPIEVAYNRSDYQSAISQFSSYDLILVDTAGRNFRDRQYMKELNNSIVFDDNMATYLVLSLTAKPKDILAIYEQFRHIPVKELIFTKMDETRQYGSMLNVMLEHEMGIAYLTNGQDVPDDLLNPSAEMVSNFIAGENSDT